MTAYLLDWCGLLVRWLHVIAGIAWIGSSFYFVWLDNSLEPLGEREPPDPRVAGELWAVHGGGFYRARKYRIAPEVLPPTLHWFYWEAYTTWLSGFGLLCLLYFLRAEGYLIDPAVLPLSKPIAIGLALLAIVASWLIYDGLCRSLGQKPRALAASVAIVTAIEAWALCQVFSGRGAFMVFGAALGSIMVANVLLVIIPGQRELVRAKQEGREPDPAPGLRGKQRSVHNTYFTLPVLFVMISNHSAMTYGARYNWVVLIAMSFAGACIRGWFVARHKPEGRHGWMAALPAVLGVATLAALVVGLAPRAADVGPGVAGTLPIAPGMGPGTGPERASRGAAEMGAAGASNRASAGGAGTGSDGPPDRTSAGGPESSSAGAPNRASVGGGEIGFAGAPDRASAGAAGVGPTTGAGRPGSVGSLPTIDVAQVQSIVEQRCLPCHSKNPTLLGLTAPPNGVVLETLDQLRAHLPEIRQQISLRAMPLGNLTGMTDDERAKVLMWIGHGALGRSP